MGNIRIWNPGTPEFARLERAAKILTEASPRKCVYKVENTYFDFGQGWTWTTLICYPPDNGYEYQALNPVQHRKILETGNLIETLAEIIQDKYWLDK